MRKLFIFALLFVAGGLAQVQNVSVTTGTGGAQPTPPGVDLSAVITPTTSGILATKGKIFVIN